MLMGIVPKPHNEVNILNFVYMVFINAKSKRKNVMIAILLSLLMLGAALLDANYNVNSTHDLKYDNVQQAGWLWGKHRTKKGKLVYRVFGISIATDKAPKTHCN